MALPGAPKRRRTTPTPSLPTAVLDVLKDQSICKKEDDGNVSVGLRGYLRPPMEEEPLLDLPLEEAARRALMRSPHSLQVQEGDLGELLELRAMQRVLLPDAPRRSYRRRRDELKTVVHWGQRKLLLSEIEFLTQHGSQCERVIYAGAAPGTHIKFLSILFPHLQWILVDPAEFKISSSEHPKIDVRQEYFTSELAERLRNKDSELCDAKLLFISDIRTGYDGIQDASVVDNMVAEDMKRQQDWVRVLRPAKAMLKFRLPYAAGSTQYFDGEIHLPVWGPRTTTEARLITDGRSTRTYDHTEYEEQMFYFNMVTRIRRYHTPMVGHGMDQSYDCAAEMSILQHFLASLSSTRRRQFDEDLGDPEGPPADKSLDKLLVRLFSQIGKTCRDDKSRRHLLSCLPTREKWYQQMQVPPELCNS